MYDMEWYIICIIPWTEKNVICVHNFMQCMIKEMFSFGIIFWSGSHKKSFWMARDNEIGIEICKA